MNAFTRLTDHLAAHEYKRGAHKGEAPADSSRRGKTNFRVVRRGVNMAVVFHRTDILTVRPDGHLILDCRGWADSVTTKQAMRHALASLCKIQAYTYSKPVYSKSQLCLSTPSKDVLYYDGIELDETGEVVSELHPFKRRRRNRDETAEFDAAIKDSGFKDMFKILYAACEAEDVGGYWHRHHLQETVTSPDAAADWKRLIASFTWETEARWTSTGSTRTCIKRDRSAVWTAITTEAKKNMYEVVATDTYEL
jgi:hypothetical protein